MLVADLEHGESLINTDYLATLEALRHRSSYSTGPRRHIENPLIALQDEHFNQLLGKISANPRGAAIKLRRVLRIMEMRLVPVAMTMLMFVSASMLMIVPMFVTMAVLVVMSMLVTVLVVMSMLFVIMLVFVLPFVAHSSLSLQVDLALPVNMRVSKIPQPLKVVYLASYLIKPVSFKFDPKLCALTAWDVARERIEGKCKVVGGPFSGR